MKAEFTNGSSVHRMYGKHESGERLAVFQYDTDAKAFAEAQLANDAARKFYDSHYLVFNSYDATLLAFHHPEKLPERAREMEEL